MKVILIIWAIFAVSIIYWDSTRWEDKIPVSVCHNSEIKMMNNKPVCQKCNQYCEVKK